MITRRALVKGAAFMSGLGRPTPSRFPYPGRPQSSGVAPNSGTVVRAQLVIISGNGGFFFYNGTPALGTLVYSITVAPGFDPTGLNAVLANATSYANVGGTWHAISQNLGGTFYFTATSPAGPWTQIGSADYHTLSIPGTATRIMGITPGVSTAYLNIGTNSISAPNSTTYYTPSGDATGATDPAIINALLAAGHAVQLLPGTYNISSPIEILQSNTFLRGVAYAPASTLDIYNGGGAVGQPGGTVINMVSGFTGDAAISFPDPGAASTNQRYNVCLADFTINGNNITGASTIPGIHVTGAWGACVMQGITVHRAPGDNLRFDLGTGGSICDDWYISNCKFTGSRNGSGCVAHELPDSWFSNCEFSENEVHGILLDGGVNTRFTSCKAENQKTGHGYYFTGLNAGGQIVWLTGCGTHLNWLDGFHFDNSSGSAQGNYHLSQCISQQDGQSGGAGNAGFGSATCKARIMLSACVSETNVTGPAFGASAITASFGLEAQTCLLLGLTAGTHDDGSNTHVLSNTNTWAF